MATAARKPNPVKPATSRFMKAREVAEALEISLDSVYALNRTRRLPARRLGSRSWQWLRADIDRYLARTEEAPEAPRLRLVEPPPTTAAKSDFSPLTRADLARALRAMADAIEGRRPTL